MTFEFIEEILFVKLISMKAPAKNYVFEGLRIQTAMFQKLKMAVLF